MLHLKEPFPVAAGLRPDGSGDQSKGKFCARPRLDLSTAAWRLVALTGDSPGDSGDESPVTAPVSRKQGKSGKRGKGNELKRRRVGPLGESASIDGESTSTDSAAERLLFHRLATVIHVIARTAVQAACKPGVTIGELTAAAEREVFALRDPAVWDGREDVRETCLRVRCPMLSEALTDANRDVETRQNERRSWRIGFAFPVGVNINEVAAHHAAGPRGARENGVRVGLLDVVSLDIGIHVNGAIVDSAFTFCLAGSPARTKLNMASALEAYDSRWWLGAGNPAAPLLHATQAATAAGLKMARPDARIDDISGEIFDVMNSFEVDMGEMRRAVAGWTEMLAAPDLATAVGKTPDGTGALKNMRGKLPIFCAATAAKLRTAPNRVVRVEPIVNLCGHRTGPYKIHCGGDTVAPLPAGLGRLRMQAGQTWAIETFGSINGTGAVIEGWKTDVSHFMACDGVTAASWRAARRELNGRRLNDSLFSTAALRVLDFAQTVGTLAWCPRWAAVGDARTILHSVPVDWKPVTASSQSRAAKKVAGNAKKSGPSGPLAGDERESVRKAVAWLADKRLVDKYAPLIESPGALVSQFEHTVFVGEKYCEVVSTCDDY